MAVKITVVVPTYNSGDHVDPLVASMRHQTLPRGEFEVLFADDGSTDGTPERLEALAAGDSLFRVIRVPRSGWPGRPRNAGVEQAAGAYVQFADHDDRMTPEALERLYAMALRNGSDIVIGKVASTFAGRGVPYALMSRTRETCTVWNAPLIDSLTPHKMFRTAFLREHGIVHPEGPWILEDQLFMVRAYLKAAVVSVLGDHVCYEYRARGDTENAGGAAMDPRTYYRNLREILHTVVAGTEPGPDRDRLLRRFYRVEMLHRAGVAPRGVFLDPPFLRDPFEPLHELAAEFVTEGTHQGLAAVQRSRSTLLRENRPGALDTFTARQQDLGAVCAIGRATWNRDRLKATFTARFDDTSTGPLLARHGERYVLAPMLTDQVLTEPVDVTDELGSFRADVLLRHTESAHLWPAGRETTLSLEEEPVPGDPAGTVLVRPVLRGTVILDPLRAAGGAPLGEGTWEVRLRLMGAGFDRYTPFGAGSTPGGPGLPGPEILSGHEIGATLSGGLSLTVRRTGALPPPRPPKITVIVPTAGAAQDAVRSTLDSLTAQSLPASDVEVILAGPGGTGGPHRTVVPDPGTDPRNAGTDAATGAYVLYLEPGDRLGSEALERMYAYGIEHDADIVAGKVAGRGAVPRELFVRDRPRATLAGDPLADSLTPDKLFDRAFLTRHGLRFPEGPLAAQAFTTVALLRAGRAAVLSGYVCCHYGPRRGAPPVEPAMFCSALRALVDTANSLTGPGAARDRLHRRWLRAEILGPLTGVRPDDENDSRRTLFHGLREVAAEGISPTAVAGLSATQRVAFGLLTDDRPDELAALARWEASVTGHARLDAVSWGDDGTLRLAFTGELRAADGPLSSTGSPDDPTPQVIVPAGLPGPLRDRFARQPLTGGATPEKASAVVVLRERASGAEYRLPTRSTVTRAGSALSVGGTARLDPATAVAGAPLGDGRWDLSVRIGALGWTRTARLGAGQGPGVLAVLTPVGHPTARDRRITPYLTDPGGDLSLRVARTPPPPPGLLRRLFRRLRRHG